MLLIVEQILQVLVIAIWSGRKRFRNQFFEPLALGLTSVKLTSRVLAITEYTPLKKFSVGMQHEEVIGC